MLWPSNVAANETRLSPLAREILTGSILPALEKRHPLALVHACLLYLATSRDGLTEAEMLDVLSLDDAVLAACVIEAPEEGVHRVPAALWAFLREDLLRMGLLIQVVSYGRLLYRLPRRAFDGLVRSYLAKNTAEVTRAHASLADYFVGKWSGVSKSWTRAGGKKVSGERGVAPQPSVVHGEVFFVNMRKLRELPYHLLAAGQLAVLDHECLFSFEFLDATLRGLGTEGLITLFQDAVRVQKLQGMSSGEMLKHLQSMPLPTAASLSGARERSPSPKLNNMLGGDIDARLSVLAALELSRSALDRHADQLAAQLLGRLHEHATQLDIKQLLEKTESVAKTQATYRCVSTQRCLAAPGGAYAAGCSLPTSATALGLVDQTIIAVTSEGSLVVSRAGP